MKKNRDKKALAVFNIDVKLDNKDFEICLLELKKKVGSPKHINYKDFKINLKLNI